MSTFKEGQAVTITDSANGRQREGTVVFANGNKVDVYVPRFDRVFGFQNGATNLGRFTLDGWSE